MWVSALTSNGFIVEYDRTDSRVQSRPYAPGARRDFRIATEAEEVSNDANLRVSRVISTPSFDLRLPRRNGLGIGAASSSSKPVDSWVVEHWQLSRLRALNLTGRGVRVGIIDSGLDIRHPAFSSILNEGRLLAFSRFNSAGDQTALWTPSSGDIHGLDISTLSSNYHGTHCSGILCAGRVEDKGEGVAPGINLVVANVLDSGGGGEVKQIYAGIDWIKSMNCDIVSMSLGWWGFRDHWARPIEDLLLTGAAVVAASGNEYNDFIRDGSYAPTRSPGNYPFLNEVGAYPGYFISVGAIDRDDLVASFSGGGQVIWPSIYIDKETQEGPRPTYFSGSGPVLVPTVVAPGVAISAPIPDDMYDTVDGTSQATPHVAGLIALELEKLRRANPSATPREAATSMLDSLVDLGPKGADDRYGLGRPDVNAMF